MFFVLAVVLFAFSLPAYFNKSDNDEFWEIVPFPIESEYIRVSKLNLSNKIKATVLRGMSSQHGSLEVEVW